MIFPAAMRQRANVMMVAMTHDKLQAEVKQRGAQAASLHPGRDGDMRGRLVVRPWSWPARRCPAISVWSSWSPWGWRGRQFDSLKRGGIRIRRLVLLRELNRESGANPERTRRCNPGPAHAGKHDAPQATVRYGREGGAESGGARRPARHISLGNGSLPTRGRRRLPLSRVRPSSSKSAPLPAT